MSAEHDAAMEAARRIVEAADIMARVGGMSPEERELRRIATMRLGAAMRNEYGIIKMARALLATEEARERVIVTSPDFREAAAEMLADHMTSETHHPGYVLVPTAAFEKMRAAIAAIAAAEPQS